MPGLYHDGEYDLAGFIVGVVEKQRMITGRSIKSGDILLGLPSTGLHTNGYSLARKLLFEIAGHKAETELDELGTSVAKELLKLHRSYLAPLRALHDKEILKVVAHLTGGGDHRQHAAHSPERPGRHHRHKVLARDVFELLRKIGDIPEADWRRTFNLGIGMIFVVSPGGLKKACKALDKMKEPWYKIGVVTKTPGVLYK